MPEIISDACVGIFAKALRRGTVKTRVARDAGDQFALEVYRMLLQRTLEQAAATGLPLYLWGSDTDCAELQVLARRFSCQFIAQQGRGLGQKMQSALRAMHAHHTRVLLIGSDCLLLPPERLHYALGQLEQHEVALIPAEDGGFVLIGSAREAFWQSEECFKGVRWSGKNTLKDTLTCLHAAKVQATILDTLWDVDTLDDVRRACAMNLLSAHYLPG